MTISAAYTDSFGITWENADNIIGGRLGDLFILLDQYKATGDPISWKAIEDELDWFERYTTSTPTCNYALFTGRLGLAYLYLQLFNLTGNDSHLHKAVSLLKAYYDSNAFRYGIIDDHSLYHGIAGVLLITLHLYAASGADWMLPYIDMYATQLVQNSNTGYNCMYWGGVTNRAKKNNGLATGTAGVAFVFHELGIFFRNGQFIAIAEHAFRYEKENGISYSNAVVGDGLSCMSCLLLREQLGNNRYDGDLFLPRIKDKCADAVGLPEGRFPGERSKHLITFIIQKDFSQTCTVLKKYFPAEANSILTNEKNLYIDNFIQAVNDLTGKNAGIAGAMQCHSVINKEQSVFLAKNKLIKTAANYPHTSSINNIEEKLQQPDSLFMQCTMKLSPSALILGDEPVADLNRLFSSEEFIDFFETYGAASYVYLLSNNDADMWQCTKLDIHKLVLDRFVTPVTVQVACQAIISFLLKQNTEVLSLLKIAFRVQHNQQLLKVIHEFALDAIKNLFMDEILLPV